MLQYRCRRSQLQAAKAVVSEKAFMRSFQLHHEYQPPPLKKAAKQAVSKGTDWAIKMSLPSLNLMRLMQNTKSVARSMMQCH